MSVSLNAVIDRGLAILTEKMYEIDGMYDDLVVRSATAAGVKAELNKIGFTAIFLGNYPMLKYVAHWDLMIKLVVLDLAAEHGELKRRTKEVRLKSDVFMHYLEDPSLYREEIYQTVLNLEKM